MSALNFIITAAGRAAIANAGTLGPVTISKVAIGTAGYSASDSQTALVAQIKQLSAIGSSVPTPGTIHIVISDTSSDVYSVKEVGLITSTGILFAVYSQTDNILVKAAGSTAMLAFDLVITNADPSSVTIGDTNFQYPPATESVKGVAEIATQAETDAGIDDERIVTPKKLAANLSTRYGDLDSKFVKKSGDTMTGPLVLPGAPTADAQASTKKYVDDKVSALSSASDSAYVKKSGDTMTGPLALSADPVVNAHAATKKYVDDKTSALTGKAVAKAWVSFDCSSGVPVIVAAYNVTSVQKFATGVYYINIAEGIFANASYLVVGSTMQGHAATGDLTLTGSVAPFTGQTVVDNSNSYQDGCNVRPDTATRAFYESWFSSDTRWDNKYNFVVMFGA